MQRTIVGLLILFTLDMFVVPCAANAPLSQVHRIGVLSLSTATSAHSAMTSVSDCE